MRIVIGSDHRGYSAKALAKQQLVAAGHHVEDLGGDGEASLDYPDIARQVGRRLCLGQADRGVLICGTGIGMAIAANKFPGVRAAVCQGPDEASISRRHNDCNVLCLAGAISPAVLQDTLTVWLGTPFEGGRHQRRIDKLRGLTEEDGC